MKLAAEDLQFLAQFIENCETAGVLWRIGKQSDGNYSAVALAGSVPVRGFGLKLHQAIKACVTEAAATGAAESLLKGV